MSLFGKAIGAFARESARRSSGEMYQRGFNDARAGYGKDPDIIKLKTYRRGEGRNETMNMINDTIVQAYEEGYRDGLEREQVEIRKQMRNRFIDD